MTNRHRLRVVTVCGIASVALAFMLFSERACPDELTLSAGATVSAGIGEQPYSPLVRVRGRAGRLEAAGSFDWSRKTESGAGWIAGVDVDTRLGWLIVGADYRHRNGGPWVKQTAFAHVGLQLGPGARILYRHEVYTDAARPNRSRILEASGRYDFRRPRGLFVEGLLAGTAFDQVGARAYGAYSQISVGRAWRRR